MIEPQPNPTNPPLPKTLISKKKLVLAMLSISIVLGVVIFFIFNQPSINPTIPSLNTPTLKANIPSLPSPTPFTFQELTIPYLKSREYNSSLGSLGQAIESNAYIKHLTSYDSDDFTVNGLLYIPKSTPPIGGWPAVVFVHGYIPPQQYRTLVNYDSYASFLAEKGLVVFKIDLRGHDQSEGAAGGAYYSGDYIIDTLNAYSALQNANFVDQNRVGLWGHSMAGNVVLRALAAKPSIPKVVIWAGAVYTYEDFSQFRIADNSYRAPAQESERRRKREELFATYGEFNINSWFWQQVPATNYLEDISGSIQVHHATNDPVVNISYSRNLIQILDNTSIPNQLFEYASGGHNLTGSSFNQAMSRSAEFFIDLSRQN